MASNVTVILVYTIATEHLVQLVICANFISSVPKKQYFNGTEDKLNLCDKRINSLFRILNNSM